MGKNKRILLIDGSSYLFRAYYAMPPLTNDDGEPTGAIYGVINMLKKSLNNDDFSHMAIIFDSKGKNFRHKLYPDYKANRSEMPEDLALQIEPLHQIIQALGLPLIKEHGIEADDIIGTLCQQALDQQFDCVISTGDKDFAQLVNKRTTLVNTMTNSKLDEAGVLEKFDVTPEQIIDYLALMGDSVDNIPGVPKVGPKTAAKWLKQFNDLDTLIENADSIKGKVGENLRNNLEQLALSKDLVTIRLDIPLTDKVDQLQLGAPDNPLLCDYYQRFGFKRWHEALAKPEVRDKKSESKASEDREAETSQARVNDQYQLITDQASCDQLFKQLESAPYFVLDTETTGLDPRSDALVGLALCHKIGHAFYIPLQHNSDENQLDMQHVLTRLQKCLNKPNTVIIGHHLKFDIEMLMRHGVHCRAQTHDTLLQDYVIDSNSHSRKLDALVKEHLQHDMIAYHDVVGNGKDEKSFADVGLVTACQYAAEDADMTLQLYLYYKKILQALKKQQALLDQVEWPLIPVLARIEDYGVLIDSEILKQQSKNLKARAKRLEQKIIDDAGREFNISSTKQLREVLFDHLKLPILKKTPGGQASTNEEVLQQLSEEHEIAKHILSYRSLLKLTSTYTDKLPNEVHSTSGRIHTSYHQTGTATGRLSSSNPNLQNIPIRSEDGRKIRQAFIAKRGYRIVAADYSQVELRIMAHLSQEKNLIDAFKADRDIHSATACELFGMNPLQIDPELRRRAKAINFGLIYGMSAFGLAKQLGVGRHDAQQYIDLYFKRYPGVKAFMDQTRAFAAEHGYVETIMGRRLYIPNINDKNGRLRSAAERAAINAPMQGSAADMIKLAMIGLQTHFDQQESSTHMIMQVHDELVFEVPHNDVERICKVILQTMENALSLSVPLTVDIGVATNWDDAH